MSKLDKLAKALTESTTIQDKKKTSPYDATAKVLRVEGSTAWVQIPGGVEQTPASMVVSAKKGEEVMVHVAGGNAYVTGNATSPPTDDNYAKKAEQAANAAQTQALSATKAANSAIKDAGIANQSATQAVKDAETANISAKSAVADAATAKSAANSAQASADAAQSSANAAQASANAAQKSADNANEYAARALCNLSTVESVSETLNWITAHGTMTLTTDTALDPTHVYFVADANGDYVVGNQHYSVVTEPSVSELSTYYELSIDESLNNYVATHLAVTDEGLWLMPDDNNGNRVLIATGAGSSYTTAGTYIVGAGGAVLAKFTADGVRIGDVLSQNVLIDSGHMTFTSNFRGTRRNAFRVITDNTFPIRNYYTTPIIFQTGMDGVNGYYAYFPADYVPDGGLKVMAFSGTDDEVDIYEAGYVNLFRPLSEYYPRNYMWISFINAQSLGLVNPSDSTKLKSLTIKYYYDTNGITSAAYIGGANFANKVVFGVSTPSGSPSFKVSLDGMISADKIANINDDHVIVNCKTTKANVQATDTSLTSSSSLNNWLKALIKTICAQYPGCINNIFRGVLSPNSGGYYEIYIYNTSSLRNGLPEYSFGTWRQYSNVYKKFGTSSYVYFSNDVSADTVIALTKTYTSNSYVTSSSFAGTYIRQYGKLVIAQFNFQISTNFPKSSAFTTIGTVALPSNLLNGLMCMVPCAETGEVLVQITASGQIQLYNYKTTAAKGWVRASGVGVLT